MILGIINLCKEYAHLRVSVLVILSSFKYILNSTNFNILLIGWANYVKGIKNSFNEQLRIANSYRRWKNRQKMLKIMKTWRHQAIFGRLDGLYTRQMLLRSLGEQKLFCSNMQKLMGEQTMELEECRVTVVQVTFSASNCYHYHYYS